MNDYGCDPDGKINEFTKAYKSNPTIENYLRLRKENPEAEIEIAVTGGIDKLFYMEPELERFGIEAQQMASVLDANPEAISSIAFKIMENITKAKALRAIGEAHLIRRGLVMPDKLIDWFITCSLDAMSWNDELEIPRDLIVLIRERLTGSHPEYEKSERAYQNKKSAALIAGQLVAQGKKPTFRIIGECLDVSPSTVMRWFKPGEFEKEIAIYATWFDKNGKFRGL